MNRQERIAAMAEEAEKWVRPTGSTEDAPLVDWIPASSPLIRQVRADLVRLAQAPTTDEGLRSRVQSVLNGEARLATLLEPGGFPLRDEDELPRDVRDVIEAAREGELR